MTSRSHQRWVGVLSVAVGEESGACVWALQALFGNRPSPTNSGVPTATAARAAEHSQRSRAAGRLRKNSRGTLGRLGSRGNNLLQCPLPKTGLTRAEGQKLGAAAAEAHGVGDRAEEWLAVYNFPQDTRVSKRLLSTGPGVRNMVR